MSSVEFRGPTNIAALLIEIADEDKQANRKLEQITERAEEASDTKQLEKMGEAADYRLAGGLTESGGQLASAGCEYGAATAPTPMQAGKDKAGADMASGLGKAGGAALTRVAASDDLDAKAAEQDAARRREWAQNAHKAADDDQTLLEKGIQTEHDIQQAQNEAAMAVARMRA